MRRDAQKDPTSFPDAVHAGMLVNQVIYNSLKTLSGKGFFFPFSLWADWYALEFEFPAGNSSQLETVMIPLDNFFQVDRKLVKQTVMTSVYGVTYIGARDQIKRRLKERGAISDDTELFRASCYAAKVGFGTLHAARILGLASPCSVFSLLLGIICWILDYIGTSWVVHGYYQGSSGSNCL